jgi:hypothetical protein
VLAAAAAPLAHTLGTAATKHSGKASSPLTAVTHTASSAIGSAVHTAQSLTPSQTIGTVIGVVSETVGTISSSASAVVAPAGALPLGGETASVAGPLVNTIAPAALWILTGAVAAPAELLGTSLSRSPSGGVAPRGGAPPYDPTAPTGVPAYSPAAPTAALPSTTPRWIASATAALEQAADPSPPPLGDPDPGALRSPPAPAPFPLGGLSAAASSASGVGSMILLALAGFLVLGAPWTRRRLRFARESRWPAPFALMPERPG